MSAKKIVFLLIICLTVVFVAGIAYYASSKHIARNKVLKVDIFSAEHGEFDIKSPSTGHLVSLNKPETSVNRGIRRCFGEKGWNLLQTKMVCQLRLVTHGGFLVRIKVFHFERQGSGKETFSQSRLFYFPYEQTSNFDLSKYVRVKGTFQTQDSCDL